MSVRDDHGSRANGIRSPGWSAALAEVTTAVEIVLGHEAGELRVDDHLLDDVGLDSFALLVLASELEARLGVELPVSDEEPTVGAYVQAVLAASRVAGGEGGAR
jgi:acyl carrier protein